MSHNLLCKAFKIYFKSVKSDTSPRMQSHSKFISKALRATHKVVDFSSLLNPIDFQQGRNSSTLESLRLQFKDEARNDDNLQINCNHDDQKILDAWEC